MKKGRFYLVFGLLALIMCSLYSCRKDKIINDPNAKLSFSNDTILFDTVFTTVGSATRHFKVYNKNRGILHIDRIYIAGAAGQMFRMNVDGISGRDVRDIEIEAGDSIYIFVEVTVDPNGINTPLLVTDSIIFICNGQASDVDLVAWGQDAYFHTPPNGSGSPFFVLPCNDLWLNDKPHVIYGYAIVDSTCQLTIQPGTQVYSHPNSALLIYNSGKLDARGTPSQRIGFQGDRLGAFYDSLPGQWSGIILLEAGDSFLENCDIKNSTVGVRVESISGSISPLIINYCRIENCSNFGFWNNIAGEVRMSNCLISNCGQYNFVCTGGGFITIDHCTFANYWSYQDRNTPAFGMANFFEDRNGVTTLVDLTAEINNTIIYGTEDNEMVVNMNSGAIGNYKFNTCFIRTDQAVTNANHFINIFKNIYPVFANVASHNHHLLGTSPCINVANILFRVDYDLENYPRDANPDVGCFEFH